jgi:hypothetical protein
MSNWFQSFLKPIFFALFFQEIEEKLYAMTLQNNSLTDLHQVETLNTSAAHFLIISDLHIARGKEPSGMITGTENFFADEAFLRWIQFHLNKYQEEKPS